MSAPRVAEGMGKSGRVRREALGTWLVVVSALAVSLMYLSKHPPGPIAKKYTAFSDFYPFYL
jgi:hypothetical protein